MKILVIANGYPNKHDPQWGCFEKDQAVALKNLGHEVCIIYVDKRFRTYWRKIGLTRFIDNGIAVIGIFWFPMLGLKYLMPKFHLYLVTLMQRIVFKCVLKYWGKPDVIYAHYLYNIAFSTELKEKYGIPLVGIEHWSELTKKNLPPILRFWGEIAYSKADRILSVSESLRSHIWRHFGKDSSVVYDMLGQDFIAAPILSNKTVHRFRFITVGSLLSVKCHNLLISAFARFHLTYPNSELVIVGAGPERTSLLNQIQELKLTHAVQLAGRKNKQEVIDCLSSSHVYVLSSSNETFGVACIEGLSLGLPCIATRCGGPEEFVNEKNGILVPTNDIEALASAMKTMYENYQHYDCGAIAAEIRQRFGPQTIAKQLTEIFNNLL